MSIFGVGPWANNQTQPLGQGFTAGPYRVRYYTHVQGYGDYTPIKQQRHALLLRPRAFAAGRHMHSVSDVFQGSAAVVYKATVPSHAFSSRRLIARAAGRLSKYPTGVLSGPYLCASSGFICHGFRPSRRCSRTRQPRCPQRTLPRTLLKT